MTNISQHNNTENDKLIGIRGALAYSSPVVVIDFLIGSIVILQGMYAKYFGLPLTNIALVILIARLFDAVSDPIVGLIADRHYQSSGSRKPWIVGSSLLFVVSSYFLYVPPAGVGTLYFLCWYLTYYLAFTLFQIPHLAWANEIAISSEQKTKLYGFRSLAAFLGTLLFFTLPMLPFFENNNFTPETLKWSVLGAGIAIFPLLYFCVIQVPDNDVGQDRKRKDRNGVPLHKSLTQIFTNKPYLILLGALFFFGGGIGMWITMIYFFIDSYLGLGGQLTFVLSVGLIVGCISLSGWFFLSTLCGKIYAWCLGTLMAIIGIIGVGILEPGDNIFFSLIITTAIFYVGFASYQMLAPALLADIIDFSRWKYGGDNGATYFSIYTFTVKASHALGGALGLSVASWFGFDAQSNDLSDKNILGLRLAFCYLPALMMAISAIFIATISITYRRHSIILRRLKSITTACL